MHQLFHVEIPEYASESLRKLAESDPKIERGPMAPNVRTCCHKYHGHPNGREKYEVMLNNFWKPQLTVIGMTGLPTDLSKAGNVIVKELKVRCSMRLTPTHVPEKVVELLREQFVGRQEDDTFGAKIEFDITDAAPGFCAPDLPPRIKEIVNDSSQLVYGR